MLSAFEYADRDFGRESGRRLLAVRKARSAGELVHQDKWLLPLSGIHEWYGFTEGTEWFAAD